MPSNNDIWDRFEAMLRVRAPALLAALLPPATEAEISEAESAMCVQFPEEVRRAYLRHNGSLGDHPTFCGSGWIFVGNNWWASLEEMVEAWRSKVRVSEKLRHQDSEGFFPSYEPWWDAAKVRPVWWSSKWIPLGLSVTPQAIYFDLDPAPKGAVGQLLNDDGMQEASVIATSLNHYLEMLIDRVERKVLVFGNGWELADPDQSVYGAHGFDWNQLP
jgi:cell wall assembly regulator SMI1